MWNKFLAVIIVLLIATNIYAYRISRPVTLKYPITEEQVSQLNKYLEELWLIQNGRQELDVVTTTKSSAKEGEIWIILTGATSQIQWKAGGDVHHTP